MICVCLIQLMEANQPCNNKLTISQLSSLQIDNSGGQNTTYIIFSNWLLKYSSIIKFNHLTWLVILTISTFKGQAINNSQSNLVITIEHHIRILSENLNKSLEL